MGEPPVMTNVQGLVRAAYKHLHHASFVVFKAAEGATTGELRAWLADLQITDGFTKDDQRSLNIAFTELGLRALGMSDGDISSFPEVFRQGMIQKYRARLLGDHGDSDALTWSWGGPKKEDVHGVLLCYAVDPSALAALVSSVLAGPVQEVKRLPTDQLADSREHFGFRDGMGQPEFRDIHPHTPFRRPIATGDLLLGYDNEYGKTPQSPTYGDREFGKDGTYVVLRQLEQDVGAFWRFVREKSELLELASRFPEVEDPVIFLAAKLVGRWPSGAPLVLAPRADKPELANEDGFDYGDDTRGERCPFGSHVRRANPRNWFLGSSPEQSLEVASRHRILRRGRTYGPPLVRDIQDTRALSRAADDQVERGLLFMCLNASIDRQFELVQHNWLNNPKFGGLHGGADPLVGDHQPASKAQDLPSEFLIPASPVRCRLTGLERFVTVRGGSYFFLPSLPALRMLAGPR